MNGEIYKNCSTEKLKHNKKNEQFISTLNDLFDIAQADALNIMKIEEDRSFLISQRQKNRPGSMLGVDLKITRKKERAAEPLKVFEENRKRTYSEMEIATTFRDTTLLSDASTSEDEEDMNQPGPSKSPTDCTKKVRGNTDFITAKLAAAFDRCKISDRDAVHILIATAEAIGKDLNELVINRTSIRRSRICLRKERAENIRNNYKISIDDSITIHWDGKLLPALTGKYNVDRLPIVASCNGKEQLLGVPALDTGTGVDQANAIFQTLEDWCVTDNIQALCCDTTASNMGRIKGASVLLEYLLQRNILYVPCRHHIFEIVLRSVFEVKFGITTSGPDVPILKQFREFWSNVNTTNFEPGIKNEYVEKLLHNVSTEIIKFCISYLNKKLPREDYRELLELTIIFLGGVPSQGLSFKIPGAIHHARWMAKAIYCLKIYIFRKQFDLKQREEISISSICVFIVKLYVKVWFKASLTSCAPLQDLTFLKDLIKYQSVDKSISDISIKKMCGHLWYLSPEAAAFSFFDDDVSAETKKKMITALNTDSEDEF
ncbi:hypothetical protein AGLY_017771 [Aphis glycines]|uniref:DUF659 domain-containing protein n=1 Tax=Aphis glycines TaxID=307491 RepID=A0A6G0STY3_APHGL|nr:hypothetical protein AGLY_017771 [Aphis glycines]